MNSAALSISNLRYRYPGVQSPAWTIALDTLSLARGEQMLLTAASGRGKSTLLHLIAGLIDPQEGSVSIDGQGIHGLHGPARDRFRGRHVGMIFQTFHLLHGFSAVENVMAAMMISSIPAGEHRERALGLLSRLGIDRPLAKPEELSVGQQQRVAVARALACNPVLVLADEPTASLDPENAAVAIELIKSACHERSAALLCVSHDPAMAERFERRERLGVVGNNAEAATAVRKASTL
ncbi:MAG: ABC transporter ATP-binding protein [Phycisphaerales bacterium]|nr:ABC transporter ATP-binding protein [Phycisphaerales bacterium]